MPRPYADLQVVAVGTTGAAASGQPLRVEWEVANRGIGPTDSADWRDEIWLSRNADGSDRVASFGWAQHIGQLAAGESYRRSLELTLPEGIAGDHYLNVRSGGPFEFIFGDNNRASSPAIPVTLSNSADLVVEHIGLPQSAVEGDWIDVSWTVTNQGVAAAAGGWRDSLRLLPAGGGAPIELGSFAFDRALAAGERYTRSEQLRLPARSAGPYRLQVVSNAAADAQGRRLYEHGSAAGNNSALAAGLLDISLRQRPDLRLTRVEVAEHVPAGGTTAIRYTTGNFGSAATSGLWTDKAYLSLDAFLSSDDLLVGEIASPGALAAGEFHTATTARIDLPLRLRGDVFLIVVADANGQVDEHPNEANNVLAVPFTIDPLPFADLVTSEVVAPSQAVHGASIEVRYRVANLGSARTRGEADATESWTDSVWLARDQRRPGAFKGDILLGTFEHVGKLDPGEDYRRSVQVRLPEGLPSGQYYLSVWSDTHDLILEDTLASQINPEDPQQIDGNNHRARPIGILGATPPDLVLAEVLAPDTASAGGNYSYQYRVVNRGERFSGDWVDSVYLADNPDWQLAREVWYLGEHHARRTLADGEGYTVSQSLLLAPSVSGRFLIVRSDSGNRIAEANELNNSRAHSSQVSSQAADLRVTEVRSESVAFSGEETRISWTVGNFGADVWAGTRSWVDAVYLSRDPVFDADRALLLGSFIHANGGGLASGGSYGNSATVRLPAGGDGPHYVYVITDANTDGAPGNPQRVRSELSRGGDNSSARDQYFPLSVHEGGANDNNRGSTALTIRYREADLQVDGVSLAATSVAAGSPLTVNWQVSNRGSRETRTSSWFDGLYLSRDSSLDEGDFALLAGGSGGGPAAQRISLGADGRAKFLGPGESYSASATFELPDSLSGDFHLIVRADTAISSDGRQRSTIRDGLPGLAVAGDAAGLVREFRDEGNNQASTRLSITPGVPPDLQMAEVAAPSRVLAGQSLVVDWRVANRGGDTPGSQASWNDLVYLSRDRFLDLNQDHYLGYRRHEHGLAAGDDYTARQSFAVPAHLAGAYYVFVVSDPARVWGSGDSGMLRESGNEDNNAGAAPQPILVETPPAADLKVGSVLLPARAEVGEEIRIEFSVFNDSSNPARGQWTDALYLSADSDWDVGDPLIGRIAHSGDLASGDAYTAALTAILPPVRDGNWRVIARTDLYNEVFEGNRSDAASGLALPPGEANNHGASGSTLRVTVPELQLGSPLATTLVAGRPALYRIAVAPGESLRVSLDAASEDGHNELYLRFADAPSAHQFDAAHGNPVAADQQAVVSTTRAGDYYVLVQARQAGAAQTVSLRADLLPLSVTGISPDHGGIGNDAQPWITIDISGSHFHPAALVRLSRPGVFDAEPERWQVLDSSHIRAIFDSRRLPSGLYDLSVINPDGQRVTEAQCYLVEPAVESEVTIAVGGPRSLDPGDGATYSVSLQSLGNVDTPYVRFSVGVPEMGYSPDLLAGLPLPHLVFSSSLAGLPDGPTADAAGNTLSFGPTPTLGLARSDIPWAQLDGVNNSDGHNLATGYAIDLAGGGFAGAAVRLQTYPGLREWLARDFDGLRARLYMLHPEWQAIRSACSTAESPISTGSPPISAAGSCRESTANI